MCCTVNSFEMCDSICSKPKKMKSETDDDPILSASMPVCKLSRAGGKSVCLCVCVTGQGREEKASIIT